MTTAATHYEQSNTTEATLFLAFELSEKTQTPPDLVVKFQPIVLLALFYDESCDRASCINGKSRAELPSTSDDSCPPRNPMECEKRPFFSRHISFPHAQGRGHFHTVGDASAASTCRLSG